MRKKSCQYPQGFYVQAGEIYNCTILKQNNFVGNGIPLLVMTEYRGLLYRLPLTSLGSGQIWKADHADVGYILSTWGESSTYRHAHALNKITFHYSEGLLFRKFVILNLTLHLNLCYRNNKQNGIFGITYLWNNEPLNNDMPLFKTFKFQSTIFSTFYLITHWIQPHIVQPPVGLTEYISSLVRNSNWKHILKKTCDTSCNLNWNWNQSIEDMTFIHNPPKQWLHF